MSDNVEDRMRAKLTEAFAPDELELVNESHLHHGHAGSPMTGESHFRLRIVSARFDGLSRLERQRAVYRVLADEMAGPVHALAVSAEAPTTP